MPGYRPLPDHVNGAGADTARRAEILMHQGDLAGAASILEVAVDEAVASSGQIPMWLCGRLADCYRRLKRYADEVALLERFERLEPDSSFALRYSARLMKARVFALRHDRNRSTPPAAVAASLSKRPPQSRRDSPRGAEDDRTD